MLNIKQRPCQKADMGFMHLNPVCYKSLQQAPSKYGYFDTLNEANISRYRSVFLQRFSQGEHDPEYSPEVIVTDGYHTTVVLHNPADNGQPQASTLPFGGEKGVKMFESKFSEIPPPVSSSMTTTDGFSVSPPT